MQTIQSELEVISAKNGILEQDFENEIMKKNNNSKEIGQIINSINNIFNICKIQQAKRQRNLDKQDVKINEDSKNLVELLVAKLDIAHRTVDELVKVYQQYGQDYSVEKAYAEDIEAQIQATKARAPQGTPGAKPTKSTQQVDDSTGMKTGKLQTGSIKKSKGADQ